MTDVYIIKNLVNGRVYVGKTGCGYYRFYLHIGLLKRGKHSSKSLQSDFDKYGEKSFVYRTLFENLDEQEAKRLEIFMMKVLKSQNPTYGYNDSDRSGNGKWAVASRWRTSPFYWSGCGRAALHENFPEVYDSIDWNRKPKVNDRYA